MLQVRIAVVCRPAEQDHAREEEGRGEARRKGREEARLLSSRFMYSLANRLGAMGREEARRRRKRGAHDAPVVEADSEARRDEGEQEPNLP